MSFIINYLYKQYKVQPVCNILSINGGGVKGFYSLYLLRELYRDKNISDYFDVICGTSVGSIIAICIANKMNLDDIANLFDKFILSIFDNKTRDISIETIIMTSKEYIQQIQGSKYDVQKLHNAVLNIFGDKKLKDLEKTVYIPSYCISKNKIVVFSNKTHPEYSIVDVILASTAAPTYFPMHMINDDLYIDGGLWANNPSMIGLVESLKNKNYNKCNILSIGNVNFFHKIKSLEQLNLGIQYLGEIFDLIFLSNEQAIQKYTEELSKLTNSHYIYMDGTSDFDSLSEITIKLDDSYPDIIKKLKIFGECKGREMALNSEIIKYFF